MQKLIIGIAPAMSVEIESENMKDVIAFASFWSSLPVTCPKCGNEVKLFYREPQDYQYWGMQCMGPTKHETNFGVYKNLDRGLFYKGDESWEVWTGNGNGHQEELSQGAEPQAELSRLDVEIKRKWATESRSLTLDAAIEKRFGRSLDRLTIAEKRDVLNKLQAA